MLSKYQFAVLKILYLHKINLDHLFKYKDTSIYFLFKRGYLIRNGGYIELTQNGIDAYNEYMHGKIPLRKNQADLTERTSRYLRVAVLRKRA